MQTQHTIDGDRTPDFQWLIAKIHAQAQIHADVEATVHPYGLGLWLLKGRRKMVELENRITPPGQVYIGPADADLREDIVTGLRGCESVLVMLDEGKLILRGSDDAQAFDRYMEAAIGYENDPEAFHAEDKRLFRFADLVRRPITASV